MRDAICVEELTNTPAIALVNKGFLHDAKQAASGKGMPNARIVPETIRCECSDLEAIEVGVSAAIDDIIAALTGPLTEEEKSPKEEIKKHARIPFKGGLEEVNRFFYMRGWTDGLPIIPPTEEAVKEMLTGTDLPADYIVTKLVPRMGWVTVEKIAINAVMAGALPTYLPVLIAAVQTLMDPKSMFYHWGVSNHSYCPFWIVNGPIRNDLNVASTTGALSPGDIANATIGRAMGLIIKNIGGSRKGMEDMGVLGNPGKYSTVIAEGEENSPWEPLHVEQGLKSEDSAITLACYNSFIQMWPYTTDAKGVLNGAIYNIPPARAGVLTLILNPAHASWLSDDGWTKEEIKTFIREHTSCPAHRSPKRWWMSKAATSFNAMDSLALMATRDDIDIIVAGGPGNVMGLFIGPYVYSLPMITIKVELPANWEKLVAKYRDMIPQNIT
ncbi:hypothetical protein ACFLV0_00425 [Chloroflexota bacterium]